MMRVIFVCSGNICRSPMAQYAWTARAKERGVATMAISMGTLNIPMERASGTSVEVMRELGIDLSPHRSQGLAQGILARADRIYVMERKHEQKLLAEQPALRGKVRLLGALDTVDAPEIPDPIGKEREFYLSVRDRIVNCIDIALAELAPARS